MANPTLHVIAGDIYDPRSRADAIRCLPDDEVTHVIGWHAPEHLFSVVESNFPPRTRPLALWKQKGVTPITTKSPEGMVSHNLVSYKTMQSNNEIDGMVCFFRDWRKRSPYFHGGLSTPFAIEIGAEASCGAIAIGLALAQGKSVAIHKGPVSQMMMAMCYKYRVDINCIVDNMRRDFDV